MTVELVWYWYCATVTAAVLLFGDRAFADGAPWTYAAVHVGFAVALAGIDRLAPDPTGPRRRFAVGAFTLVALPSVFTAMSLTLPHVHPEGFEWTWMAADRALLGTDPTVALQRVLVPWFTELIQWIYASFYFIPIAVIVAAGLRRGAAAFDRTLLTVVLGFLLSYLGYYLWPTLPPFRFLPHDVPIRGVWMAAELHRAIDDAEFHRWNCFPSGHTMMSLLSLVLAWRHVRPLFVALAPVVALLVFSTVALRYHYFVDVVAGALAVLPTVWFADWLDRTWRGAGAG